ncbi:MAG: hypothetical protein LBT81_02230 [Helicobacteraceae bacterium]|jgi:hypothetical protein|nr:hypothetical protein [Helicobacteraceae bacterium]
MKRLWLWLGITLPLVFAFGCTGLEEYKPLYQAEPQEEDIAEKQSQPKETDVYSVRRYQKR